MPTTTFSSAGWHTFDVPAGVENINVVLNGAGSGSRAAGRVTGRLPVRGSQTLHILVGEAGKAASGATGGPSAVGGGARGGNGGGAGTGGRGGGGASYIRLNSKTGTIRCVAAGAGGDSGDSGNGGQGGASTGENGFPGTAGANSTGNSTGGTQTQGGKGGTSSAGAQFDGTSAADTALAAGGVGGSAPGFSSHGGGGGGGGFRGGGGGQASLIGYSPGGGGAGGSNYTGALVGASSLQGAGGTGNGSVSLTWVSPPPRNQPPSPPTELRVEGQPEQDEQQTKQNSTVTVTAKIDDPDAGQKVRMVVRWSSDSRFPSYRQKVSTWETQGSRARVDMTGLAANTHYYARAYTQDSKDQFSVSYNAFNFWTNRKPTAELQSPANNSQFDANINVTFVWDFHDPDTSSVQKAYELRYRRADSLDAPAGDWHTVGKTTSFESHTFAAGTFRSNTFYEWTVRLQDAQGLWGEWADAFSFYVVGTSSPPRGLKPDKDVAVITNVSQRMTWRFVDPQQGDEQCKADLRYRVVGSEGWVTLLGALNPDTPGSNEFWDLPADTFVPGYRYEWQVRTYDGGPLCLSLNPSEWSDSATFHAIQQPGLSAEDPPLPDIVDVQERLGSGEYKVMVFDRGGLIPRGEIKPLARLQWGRKRDDISNCLVLTNGWDEASADLLSTVRSWMHEIVIFRNGVRVWEGPITRITYMTDSVEFEAKDVLQYVYRRIMRQGYDDSYRLMNGEQLGLRTVVDRAALILQNALAPDDPNILPYLTTLRSEQDAKQSRVVPDFGCTAWEEIDDLAATAGLDYTAVGRRILLWDTHRAIGRLPEMRDGDFSNPPIVTEYGMNLANFFAVTNNNGIWGGVYATVPDPTSGNPNNVIPMPEEFYGRVEQLASAYGDAAAPSEEALTAAAREALARTFRSQAARNMIGRWPTPLVVRVPDNSALNPEVNLSINHLVPGVWIPVRSVGTLREVAQMQKLDSMNVEVDESGEKVTVVMSPAPDGERDPDAEQSVEEG